MNATVIDVDTAFELIVLEEMLAMPAMEADANTFSFAYKY
jgi:hypothetical protein